MNPTFWEFAKGMIKLRGLQFWVGHIALTIGLSAGTLMAYARLEHFTWKNAAVSVISWLGGISFITAGELYAVYRRWKEVVTQ